jgi:tetratricopeptide (TPR) repeat protein
VDTILRKDPRHREARLLLARAHLSRNAYGDALAIVEGVLRETDAAIVHYLHGKTLFGLGRLHDSREAFDRAFALDPKLLEAMLLRREVDRHIRMHRNALGEHNDAQIDIPVSLVELRAVLVSGDIAQAIAALSAHPYREQPDAQLLLARLVAFSGAPQRAIIIYDEAAASEPHRHAALLGKATLLLDLPKGEESALAIFDELCAEEPTDADASEGRARALEKLGRIGEAAAEFRRCVSLAAGRSDLRVRAAADWLRDHPQHER